MTLWSRGVWEGENGGSRWALSSSTVVWGERGLPGPGFPAPRAQLPHAERSGKEQHTVPVSSAPPPQGRDVVRVETTAESDRDD